MEANKFSDELLISINDVTIWYYSWSGSYLAYWTGNIYHNTYRIDKTFKLIIKLTDLAWCRNLDWLLIMVDAMMNL